jgi:hypothetical protein
MPPRMDTQNSQRKLEGMASMEFVKSRIMIVVLIVDVKMER